MAARKPANTSQATIPRKMDRIALRIMFILIGASAEVDLAANGSSDIGTG